MSGVRLWAEENLAGLSSKLLLCVFRLAMFVEGETNYSYLTGAWLSMTVYRKKEAQSIVGFVVLLVQDKAALMHIDMISQAN